MELKELFAVTAKELAPQLSNWRRHIHSNPELSYSEFNTMKYISDELNSMGVNHEFGIADTGVIATIEGINPDSRIVAIRSDHDALPIKEENAVEYISTNEGVMHACGHDAHTSSLLGAAFILEKHKSLWEGTIRLIFQPGEEKLPGGASLMVKAGALENPQPSHIIGQHVFPDLTSGHIGLRAGTYMASADEVYLIVGSNGGHAALIESKTNPLLVASEILLEFEKLINERPNKNIKTVLAFGFIEGLGATNVIPKEVTIHGTFRSLDEDWRFNAHAEMHKIVERICSKRGVTHNLDIRIGYPSVFNNVELTSRIKQLAIDYLGKEKVHDLLERMTAEDFSFYSREIPGCFYRLGTASPDTKIGHEGLHTSLFDIDERALIVGAGFMAYSAVNS